MRIAISAESTIDLPKELLEKYEIYTIPFTIILGEETALDGEVDSKVLFDYTDKTGKLPKTSAINEFQYQEYFESLKAKGYDRSFVSMQGLGYSFSFYRHRITGDRRKKACRKRSFPERDF